MKTEHTKQSESDIPFLVWTLVLVTAALMLNSCSTLDLLGKDVRSMDRDTRLIGHVTGSKDRVVKVYVLKKNAKADEFSVADSASPNAMGDFAFLLPPKKSYFLAAVEKPSSGSRSGSERISIYGDGTLKEIPPGRASETQPIVLDLGRKVFGKNEAAWNLDKALESWKPEKQQGSGAIPIACGEIVSLNDALFDGQAGQQGVWAPVTSAKRNGLGVYFLQPYDPQKIPVVFVHGIGGTPRDWQTMIEALDSTRYQAWVYSYPSGLPLESAAKGLADMSVRLHRHYGFERLHVVAHSMGGLVARRSVQMVGNEAGESYVASLTTLSTPWNGVPFAALGTVSLPVPVPSWFDLRPNSPFIRKVLDDPLPAPHLLVSTKKSRFKMTLPRPNDGTVSLASQLDPRAVSVATRTLTLNQDHDEVLKSRESIRALGEFLKASQEGRALRNDVAAN